MSKKKFELLDELANSTNTTIDDDMKTNSTSVGVGQVTISDKRKVDKVSIISILDWMNTLEYREEVGFRLMDTSTIMGLVPRDQLLFNYPSPSDDSKSKRSIELINNPNTIPMIDSKADRFDVYPKAIRCIFKIGRKTAQYVKLYNKKLYTKSVIVFCDNQMIPVSKQEIRLNDFDGRISVVAIDEDFISDKLDEEADIDRLIISYETNQFKTIRREIKRKIKTNRDAVDWFLKLQEEVIDIPHHMKIDQTLINIFGGAVLGGQAGL